MKKWTAKCLLVLCCAALLLSTGCHKNGENDTSAVSDVSAQGGAVSAVSGADVSGNNGGENSAAGQKSNENGSASGETSKVEFSSNEEEALAVAKALHAADERGGLTEDSEAYESALYSVGAPTQPEAAQQGGEMLINGEKCKVYTVSDGAGHIEQIAVSPNDQWYYKDQYGDYIPVTLMDDGTLTVGDLPLDGESVLDIAEWMLRKFTGNNTCAVEQNGNGLVNGVDCDFYVATDAKGNVLGAIAHGPDGEYYYREKTGFLYRLIGRELGKYWLAEPVSEFTKSALMVYNEVSGKTADSAKSNEAIIINNQSATQYAILKGGKTVANIAVTTDNQWYYDNNAKGNYHRVVWSESGAKAS